VAAVHVAWHLRKWGTPKILPADLGRANCVVVPRTSPWDESARRTTARGPDPARSNIVGRPILAASGLSAG